MKSITWYVAKQVASVTIFVTVTLCFAIWLTQSLRLIDLILNRGLPVSTFLYMATLLLPRFLIIVVPIAAFCATLFTYNKMISDSELIVMRSAGLSQYSLAKPGLIVAILVTGFTFLLTLYLLPTSFRHFKDLQYQIRHDFTTVLLQEGVFNTLADGITVYVRDRGPDGELHGILLHDSRNPDKPVTMMAERGALVPTAAGPRVVLVNGNRQQVDRKGGQLSLLYFDRYTVEVKDKPDQTESRQREPRERYMRELFGPLSEADQHYRAELIAEGHSRIITPILPLTYAVLGMAMLLSGGFSRRGQTGRVLTAILLMTGILVSSFALQNLAVKHPALILAMYANALVPLLVGLYYLVVPRRVGRARPPGEGTWPKRV